MNWQAIHVRLLPEALAAIDEYAARLQITRSTAIREALLAGLPSLAKRASAINAEQRKWEG